MTKILFVDDENNVLDGLRRMLRGKRKEWDMVFAIGGEQALQIAGAENDAFDLICTDMRMPGMDGAELLARFRERWPDTLRFVLSGHSEVTSVMRSIPVAHRFLNKPCEAEQLKEAIDGALKLYERIRSDDVKRMIGQVSSLPACPNVFRKLMSALTLPDVDMQRVASIVEEDASIASKLLQIVNSSFFGLGHEIVDIAEATHYLGLAVIKDLVLSVELFEPPADADAELASFLNRQQSRCMRTASVAKQILEAEGIQSDEVFTGALLHDIGLVAMAASSPGILAQLAAKAECEDRTMEETERDRYGITHAEVGAYLLGVWGLPCSLIEIVAYHHSPMQYSMSGFGAVGAVHVASGLVESAGDGCFEWCCGDIDRGYLEACGVMDRLELWESFAQQPA